MHGHPRREMTATHSGMQCRRAVGRAAVVAAAVALAAVSAQCFTVKPGRVPEYAFETPPPADFDCKVSVSALRCAASCSRMGC